MKRQNHQMPDPDSNFLSKYVSLFRGTEVPERFAMWAGISCLSAMLERRIWIDMSIYTIYPNSYIVFVADSGRMRKSTAINMTKKLLAKSDPGPRIVAQKITPEALIDALRLEHNDDPKALMKESCGGIVIADELVSFLNKDTYERGLGSLLIQFWDCPDSFEYRTRNREAEVIQFGHLSLLGGTTVHTLREALPILSLGDGFSSRVLFVYVDETPTPVPRPVQGPWFKKIEEELVLHLQALSTMQGEVKMSNSAIEFFDKEYRRFFHSPMYDDVQFAAYASRRDKHLLKVAMCLMAAESQQMTINVHHLTGAKILLEDIEIHFSTVFDRITMSEAGSITEQVYRLIELAPQQTLPRSEIVRKFGHKVSASEMSKITETLTQSGRVKLGTVEGKFVLQILKENKY